MFIINGRQVFKVHYEDDDEEDYYLDKLLQKLVPKGNREEFLETQEDL